MTDAEAWNVIRCFEGDRVFGPWFDVDAVYSLEVVDGVVELSVRLSSDYTDGAKEDLAKMFSVPADSVEGKLDEFGCPTCGWGSTAVFKVRLVV